MIPAELKAESGDKILPKFKKLVAWIDSQRLVSVDDRVVINATPNGSLVSMVDRPATITTPLVVRLSGTKFFSVGEGYINGKLPKIKPSNGQLQEIIDPDGVSAPPAQLPTTRPLLVCAQVVFNKDYVLESCEIVTKRPDEVPRTGSANLVINAEKLTGVIPLAFIRSNKFTQFVSHNLQVRAYENAEVKTIIYWPA
jgi:hypothetical protein